MIYKPKNTLAAELPFVCRKGQIKPSVKPVKSERRNRAATLTRNGETPSAADTTPLKNQKDHDCNIGLHDGGRQEIGQPGKWIVREHYSPNVTRRYLAGLHLAAGNAAVMPAHYEYGIRPRYQDQILPRDRADCTCS